MKRMMLILISAFLLAGCGPKVIPTNTLDSKIKRPEKNWEDVELFYKRKPERPYKQIALLEWNTSSSFGSTMKGFRKKAAKLGADAIIVDEMTNRGQYIYTFANPESPVPVRIPERQATARAIIWE